MALKNEAMIIEALHASHEDMMLQIISYLYVNKQAFKFRGNIVMVDFQKQGRCLAYGTEL